MITLGSWRRMERNTVEKSRPIFSLMLTCSAMQSGMSTLLEDAIGKIEAGLTTCEEVLRVFGPQNAIEIPCRHCGSVLEERYTYCPFCGAAITRNCDNCHKYLATDWSYCPHCRSPAPAEADQ